MKRKCKGNNDVSKPQETMQQGLGIAQVGSQKFLCGQPKIHTQIRNWVTIEPEWAVGPRTRFMQLCIEAKTLALITGNAPVGESRDSLG